nr:MAG TPA: hypothetical protein [Caudoviricetes sp.]
MGVARLLGLHIMSYCGIVCGLEGVSRLCGASFVYLERMVTGLGF